MTSATPTDKDKRLIHTTADRVWEWAKQVEDEGTRQRMKMLATDMHTLASQPPLVDLCPECSHPLGHHMADGQGCYCGCGRHR